MASRLTPSGSTVQVSEPVGELSLSLSLGAWDLATETGAISLSPKNGRFLAKFGFSPCLRPFFACPTQFKTKTHGLFILVTGPRDLTLIDPKVDTRPSKPNLHILSEVVVVKWICASAR